MNIHWKWLGWFLWSNAITLIQVVQVSIAGLMIYAEAFPHEVFRKLVIANAILTGIISQIKANRPPGPPPERDKPDADDRAVDHGSP